MPIQFNKSAPIRIGTRTSMLAMRQAHLLKEALATAAPTAILEIVPMNCSGDWKPEQKEKTFATLGGNKGLFAKELEHALQQGAIDMAIHSAKDLETAIPDGLCIAGYMQRADARDAFISHKAASLAELPAGSVVGTSSLRRGAQLLHRYPHLKIEPFRGNIDTRLRKLHEGQVDATFLACAGLQRANLMHDFVYPLAPEMMLPAVGQGALIIEMRQEQSAAYDLIREINCEETEFCVTLERKFLEHIDGSCHTPVAAFAQRLSDNTVDFRALVATPDGQMLERRHEKLTTDNALQRAAALGDELRALMPKDLLTA